MPGVLSPFGVGQSWQAVSRVDGVPYVNNTGRCIVFRCAGYSGANLAAYCTINGVVVEFMYSIYKSAYAEAAGSIEIPAGATYQFSGLPSVIQDMKEFR